MYEVIYADPPWTFRVWNSSSPSRKTASHYYETLTTDDLKRLNVQSLASKNCALLLWATMPNIPEAIEVGESWGFSYKTAGFTWVKSNKKSGGFYFGMGHYTRANAELCLLFLKGSKKRISNNVSQIIYAPITRHSAKPHEAYERIEALFEGPYVELFARNTREGWRSIGNEIDGMDIRDVLVDKI